MPPFRPLCLLMMLVSTFTITASDEKTYLLKEIILPPTYQTGQSWLVEHLETFDLVMSVTAGDNTRQIPSSKKENARYVETIRALDHENKPTKLERAYRNAYVVDISKGWQPETFQTGTLIFEKGAAGWRLEGHSELGEDKRSELTISVQEALEDWLFWELALPTLPVAISTGWNVPKSALGYMANLMQKPGLGAVTINQDLSYMRFTLDSLTDKSLGFTMNGSLVMNFQEDGIKMEAVLDITGRNILSKGPFFLEEEIVFGEIRMKALNQPNLQFEGSGSFFSSKERSRPAGAARPPQKVTAFYQKSGLATSMRLYESNVEQMRVNMIQRLPEAVGSKFKTQTERLFDEAKVRQATLAFLQLELDPALETRLLQWLNQPATARLIKGLDTALANLADFETYVDGINLEDPREKVRAALANAFLEASDLPDRGIYGGLGLTRATIALAQRLAGRDLPENQLDLVVASLHDQLVETGMSSYLLMVMYGWRDESDNTIREFIAFFDTEDGTRFSRIISHAAMAGYTEVAKELERRLAGPTPPQEPKKNHP